MDIVLTSDQERIFTEVKNFFTDDLNPAIVIMGSAGTGKTSLTQYIVNHIMDTHIMEVVAIAPTHKARRVLCKKLNNNRVFKIPSLTIASLLGKMREHTYIGAHKYTNGSKQKMDKYKCFILDEVSMVSDNDLDQILNYVCEYDKKLILIGDKCQIPAPSQQLIRDGNICYKPDSSAFDICNLHEMRMIVRQTANSPIIKIATYLRDNLFKELDIKDILYGSLMTEEEICIPHDNVYKMFQEDYMNKLDTRIIAYTNSAVKSHNEHVRKIMGFTKSLHIGELLTGYANVGWPTQIIENGTDYTVLNMVYTKIESIDTFRNLVGNLVDLRDIDDEYNISRRLFFIDITHSANINFVKDLINRAEKVNQKYSSSHDYKNYMNLKNRAIFLEDVYKYDGNIMTSTNLRQLHPLLFTKISDIIDVSQKSICVSELTKKISDKYGDIIESRLNDNKAFADAEVFADQFMVVEKDIYYGYSITAHKTQGSTYDSVYVDEHDFKKISNKWNYRMNLLEERYKERNQLRYVAYTRASKKLKIII